MLLEAVTSSTSAGATALTYVPAAVENIGIVADSGRPVSQDIRVAVLLQIWLEGNPRAAPAWRTVRKTYEETCKRLSIEAKSTEPARVAFCRPVSLFLGQKEFSLFQSTQQLENDLGQPDSVLALSSRYTDLREVRWKGGDLVAIVERGRTMRITSRIEGSKMLLRLAEESNSTEFAVSVGMTKVELGRIFNLDAGQTKALASGLSKESWLYFDGVGIGFTFQGDKVSGITVAPTAN
jgi:hypothetical protein